VKAPKILFLATEDWFVASHFRPLLERARADGFEVVIAARDSGIFQEREGYRFAPMPFARRALAPGDIWRETRAVQKVLEAERPNLVHAIALKPIALALLAGMAARTPIVMALTGRGYLEARGGWRRIILNAIAKRMRAAVARGEALLLTENEADQRWVEAGAPLAGERMMVMPGAGVDPDAFQPSSEPSSSPIVAGIVARLVRSKGIDLAVAAISRLRGQGLAIELHIAGAVDAENPEHVAVAELESWRATPGVKLLGRIGDVNGFWAAAHIACLPSRGGEGLPRSLLEAAACCRPIVTSDAPGCADFVVDGIMGLVCERGNAQAIAAALMEIAENPTLRLNMGKAARERVCAHYTELHAANVASLAWRRALSLEPRR
jgi:glycosyltransferase involved in cell wall biosynthesis